MKHKDIFLLTLLLALTLALVGCGGSGSSADSDEAAPPAPQATETAPAPTGDAVAGEPLFVQSCSACHGPGGKGVPNLGKDMTTSAFIQGMNDQDLLAFVKVGRPVSDPANTTNVDMPPKGGNPALTDEQLLDIIAYIRTLK